MNSIQKYFPYVYLRILHIYCYDFHILCFTYGQNTSTYAQDLHNFFQMKYVFGLVGGLLQLLWHIT